VEDRRRVRAILPYTKVPETDEIRYVLIVVAVVKFSGVFINAHDLSMCSYVSAVQ